MDIKKLIEDLIERLPDADTVEAARIHTRIIELEALEEKHATT